MKIVKVHIRRGDYKRGEPMMVYPARYDAREVDQNGLGPCAVNGVGAYSKGIGKGASEEWCFIILDDALADEYALDPNMEIVDAETADDDMEAWRVANHESEVVIRDAEMVAYAQAQKAAKGAASIEEAKILDPSDPTPGINYRLRKVAEIVADTGKTLTAKVDEKTKG